MPRFAANLAYLFTERPLIERFAAAAAAGFRAVELQLPYAHAPTDVRAELERHRLTRDSGDDRHGHHDVSRATLRHRSARDVHREARDVVAATVDVADVHADAHVESNGSEVGADRRGRA